MRTRLELQKLWARARRDASADLVAYGRPSPDWLPAQCPFTPKDFVDDFLDYSALAARLISELALPNVRLQYDLYHRQIMEGDVAMAIREFGPLARHYQIASPPDRGEPDDGDRAMSAALDMMTALDALNARWTAEGRPTVQIGIGLNFGEAFAGNIGSERRLEYTVIGDTVNTASRLCSVAKKGEIIISEDFRKTLTKPPALQPLEPVPLKGKTQPVPIFLVKR